MSNRNHFYGLSDSHVLENARLGTSVSTVDKSAFNTVDRLSGSLHLTRSDIQSGRYRIQLSRFMTNQIPLISACIWTWVRLAAAPGSFRIVESRNDSECRTAETRLAQLSERLYVNAIGNRIGLSSLLVELFTSMFRDGLFGGFLTVRPDASGASMAESIGTN